jgi:hypothetical protein
MPLASLPLYLRDYVTQFGSCLEECTGAYDSERGLITMWTDATKVTKQSNVHWCKYFYSIVLTRKRLVVGGVHVDRMTDRDKKPVVVILQHAQ